MSTRQATLVGLFALFVVACGGEQDGRPASWSYVSPVIMEPNCATVSCHSKAAAVAGIDLSDPDVGYKSLLELKLVLNPGKDEETEAPRPMVVPYHPESSRIINMMRARGAERMPPDRPLAEADIELVERWILLGARK